MMKEEHCYLDIHIAKFSATSCNDNGHIRAQNNPRAVTIVKTTIMITHLLKSYPTGCADWKEFASYWSSLLKHLQPPEAFKRITDQTHTKSLDNKHGE